MSSITRCVFAVGVLLGTISADRGRGEDRAPTPRLLRAPTSATVALRANGESASPVTEVIGRSANSGGARAAIQPAGGNDPVPYFSITWTATSKGFSDVTDPKDGRRTVVSRKVVMSGSTIVRLYQDGSQDSFSPDITVTDEYDRVETTPCVGSGGVDRRRILRSITDPHRYQGTSPTVLIFPPQQRPDNSWYLSDPFSRFYSGRFFTYRTDIDFVGCSGEPDADSFEDSAGFYADTAFPGDLNGDTEGKTFRKQSAFDSPFSNDPPMHVVWTVVATKLAGDDLTVDRLEVTQGLQAADNGIPLVNGRRTVVRAYLGIGGRPGPVPAVGGILRGFVADTPLGSTLPFNPGGEIDAKAAPNWRNIDDTLNFEVPHGWTLQANLRLEVEVNHERLVFEEDYNNNKLEVEVTTTVCQDVRIGYAPIHYEPPGGFTPSDPSPAIHQGHRFLQKVYPIANGALHYSQSFYMHFATNVTDGKGPPGVVLLGDLSDIFLLSSANRPDRVVGWLPSQASTNANGRANMPGNVAWVVENGGTFRGSFAHEVGHNYGRDHTEQTTGALHWFDVSERRIQAPRPGGTDLFDFIFGIGHPEAERWVTGSTYNFLFGKICPGGFAKTLESRAATVGDNVLLSGVVNNVVPATGSLDPLHRTSTAPTHIPDPPSAGPGYCAKLKNGAGSVLAQYCFDVFFEIEPTTPGGDAASAPFGLVVPYPPGLARVELTRGTNTLLAFRTPSANPPAVTLTFPNAPGLTLTALQIVTWSGSDPDGNPLTYNVLYSSDNGASWKGVGAGITATSYPLDFSQLPGGAAARVRVQASDGFHTAEDTSDNAFAVGTKAPTATIVSPPDDGTFNASLPVPLQGGGSDLEDGSLGSAALSWSSSRDGALGTGTLLEKLLTVGSHVITLTATDSNGLTATDTVSLTVTGTPPPPSGFYTVTPCRVADTRGPAGPWGGPALLAGAQRVFPVAGQCSIPPTARAVSFNFTVVQATTPGYLSVYPGGTPLPLVSVMNFTAGQIRANNAIAPLAADGSLAVFFGQSAGTTHFLIDVNGYFE